MKQKLLILDIDGTLTNSKKEITARTKASVIDLMKRGHKCMLASGRPLCGMKWAAKELEFETYGGYLLSYNGAKIVRFDTMETIYEKRVPRNIFPLLYQYAKEHESGIISYDGDVIISGNGINEYIELESKINHMHLKEVEDFPNYFKEDTIKCMFCTHPDKTQAMELELQGLLKNEQVSVYRSEPFYVEVMPLDVNKATSIEHMLPTIGITRENTVACGDGYNDITMLKYAGVGVAMGNAHDVVKESADEVTGTNEEDGVVSVIERYFTKEIELDK